MSGKAAGRRDTADAGAAIRLAIAGLGLVGARHADAIAAVPGVSLGAIVDVTSHSVTEAEHRGVTHFPSVADMLAQDPPDGVILATPTRLHVDQAMACVAAGVPVLVEKPLSDDLKAARLLVDTAARESVPVLVGHHRRYNPLIQAAKAKIDAGQIGDVRAVHATCWFYKPDAYFAEAPWRTRKGAGPISVNLVHDIDLIRYLCGEVLSVQAQAVPSRRGFENEDLAAALLRMENGVLGTITVSDSIVSPWSWELTAKEYPIYPATPQIAYMIGGSAGALSIPDLSVWRHEAEPDWWSPIAATSSPVETSDPLLNQIAHFTEVISGAAVPLVSGEEGLRSLRVVDAIQRAAECGETVDLSPDA